VHRIRLPHGVFVSGAWRREVGLRLPTGADEERLLGGGLTPAERVSELLGRCLDVDVARDLTVGDREALLLHLRARVFGDRLPCVLACPSCDEAMDLDLSVATLLVAPYRRVHRRHRAVLDGRAVRFRLPTGADQEAAARAADVAAGVRLLVERCVDGDPLPDALVPGLAAAMARLDPQAETLLALECPACGAACSALLDAAALFLGELTAGHQRLLEEVHVLARTYHWSEAEILSLDIGRRRRYLELVTELEVAS
jgi:hypothetical protein